MATACCLNSSSYLRRRGVGISRFCFDFDDPFFIVVSLIFYADFRRGKPVNIFSLPGRITETERPMGGSLAKESLGLVGREQLLARSDCGSVYQSVRRSAPAQSRPRHLFPRICERVVWALPPQSHAVDFPTNGSNRWPQPYAKYIKGPKSP